MYVTITDDFSKFEPVPSISSPTARSPATHLREGAHLYFEGDPVEWLYQIKSGVLRLTRITEDGRRQVIAFGYPGDIVGFPCDGLHQTDCDVLKDACLQPYRRSRLENGEGDPQLHHELLQATLREISAMQDHFMMLGRKSAVEKVASFLCVLTQRAGQEVEGYTQISLPMSRGDIADFLGLTTETVSRTLTQLRKRQIIAIENVHTIIVRRPEALSALSVGARD